MAISLLLAMILAISLLFATIILSPSFRIIIFSRVGSNIPRMMMSMMTNILVPLTFTPTMVIAVRLTMDGVTLIGRNTTPVITVIMIIKAIVLLLAIIMVITLLLATIIISPLF